MEIASALHLLVTFLVITTTLVCVSGGNSVSFCYPTDKPCPTFNEPNGIYYVTPTKPPFSPGCPIHKPCQLLRCYISCKLWGDNITLHFLPGFHQGFTQKTEKDDLMYWRITSNGNAIIRSYNLVLRVLSGAKVHLENVTIVDSEISVHHYLTCSPQLIVNNCKFNSSSIWTILVLVFIKQTEFRNSLSTALALYSCQLELSGEVLFVNNTGTNGGAIAMIGCGVSMLVNTNISFINNKARINGGAIYVDEPYTDNFPTIQTYCFYKLLSFSNIDQYKNFTVVFRNNLAYQSGDEVYGSSMNATCIANYYDTNENETFNKILGYQLWGRVFKFTNNVNNPLSTISGPPSRVCLCGENENQTYCAVPSEIDSVSLQVHPGEKFNISAIVVGGDFGATTGTVMASLRIKHKEELNTFLGFEDPSMHNQLIYDNRKCSQLQYSIVSNITEKTVVMTLKTTGTESENVPANLSDLCDAYTSQGIVHSQLMNTPILVHVTILQCPTGFTLSSSQVCECYSILSQNGVKCFLYNGKGYAYWNSNMWISGVNSTELILSKICPLDSCKRGYKIVDMENNPDSQCAFNHVGRLCGGCEKNYSIAIGSSHCLYCPNNNYLALLIFFAAAGPLLLLLISFVNLTVSHGMINGLIFYANVIWGYQSILFPQDIGTALRILKVFIAWLNLDFGIEICFISGLNSFWKAWLQFIFPRDTAGLFLVGLRCSLRLAKLFGDRSVPTLATFLFLSFTKLLRAIIAALNLAIINSFPGNTKYIVWAVDGNYLYGQHPHIFLLLAAIALLVLLWIPYTLLLLTVQWVRRIDHYWPLTIIAKYKPVYDAYFAPLRDGHHYWFGVLLLTQGLFLVVSSLTLNVIPIASEALLLVVVILLLCYMNTMQVYKKTSVSMVESSFFINLIILFAGIRYQEIPQTSIMYVSISVALMEFCVIISWNLIESLCRFYKTKSRQHIYRSINVQETGQDSDATIDTDLRGSTSEEEELSKTLSNVATY